MAGPRYLIVYHSEEGQAGRVADRVASELRAFGDLVDVCAAERAPGPEGYDAVVAGDSIRNRRHSVELSDWLSEHREALARVPAALFQVSLGSAVPRLAGAAHVYVDRLTEETGFSPDMVGEFGGRIAYTSYGPWRKRTMQLAAAVFRLSTDAGRDAEYTDWAAVERFARDAHVLAVELQRASGS